MRFIFYYLIWKLIFVDLVKLPLKSENNSTYTVQFTLGLSQITLPITLDSNKIIMNEEMYDNKISSTSVLKDSNHYTIIYGTINIKTYEDIIHISSSVSTAINFVVIESNSLLMKNTIGFGLSPVPPKDNESFIYQLKDKNYINYLGFTIVPDDSIYFGDVPKDIVNNMKYKGKVKVKSYESNWNCNLTKIKVNGYIYNNIVPTIFQTKDHFILVPSTFYIFLRNNYFNEYISNNQCTEHRVINIPPIIICNCDIIPTLPFIEFIFDDVSFKIEPSLLFFKGKDKCNLHIIVNDKTQWEFGTLFLNQMVSHFDINDKSITFYSNNIIISTKYYKTIVIICIVQYVVMIITIILLLNYKLI